MEQTDIEGHIELFITENKAGTANYTYWALYFRERLKECRERKGLTGMVRNAARNRQPLDGSDAQALEGALSQVERELKECREENTE